MKNFGFILLVSLSLQTESKVTLKLSDGDNHNDSIGALHDEISELPKVRALKSRVYSGHLHLNSEENYFQNLVNGRYLIDENGTDENEKPYERKQEEAIVHDFMHYVFIEAEEKQEDAPIMLFLNGGPGASSMMGMFTELGPYLFNEEADGFIYNPFSVTQYAHLLSIESPTGVGFSYCSNFQGNNTVQCNNTDTTTAQQNLFALKVWLKRYPKFEGKELKIYGESYAGVYVPTLAKAVYDSNNNDKNKFFRSGGLNLNLTGIAVGNPCTDDASQTKHHGWTLNFARKYNVIPPDLYYLLKDFCGVDEFKAESVPIATVKSNRKCVKAYRQFRIATAAQGSPDRVKIQRPTYIAGYNAWGPNNDLWWENMARFFNRPGMQRKFHVTPDTTIYRNSTPSSMKTPLEFAIEYPRPYSNDDNPRLYYTKEHLACNFKLPKTKYDYSMLPIYRYLLDVAKLESVIVYQGDSDPCIQTEGTIKAIKSIGIEEMEGGAWRPWFYQEASVPTELLNKKASYWGPLLSSHSTSDSNKSSKAPALGGYVTNYKSNLSLITIHNAGHMVPQYQVQAAYHFLRKITKFQRLSPLFFKDHSMVDSSDERFFNDEDSIFLQWLLEAQSPAYVH